MGLTQRRTVARTLRHWMDEGRPCALATVVSTTDSAPRGVGAQLAVTLDDVWVGGLSGGCAEVGVLHEAAQLLAAGGADAVEAAVHVTMTRDELGSVGPVCGATLGVLVERVDASLLALLQRAVDDAFAGTGGGIARTYDIHPDDAQAAGEQRFRLRRTGIDPVAADAAGDATAVAGSGTHPTLDWERHARTVALTELVPAAPRLVIGGAGDIASELVRAAAAAGWRTALVDPREGFVEQSIAQAMPDVVVRMWPDEAFASGVLAPSPADAFVAAAHDERIDVPFLVNALQTDGFYVASVGSRVVQHERRAQLEEAVGGERAARHHGPAGLNLGGSDAAEIALSILAEAVATRYGRNGTALRAGSEPITAR